MKLNGVLNKLGRAVVVGVLALVGQFSAQAANLVQDFYLPMPEADIYTANKAIVPSVGATNFSTFSIVVTGDGDLTATADALLRDADLAMYGAKDEGKATWKLFDDTMRARALEPPAPRPHDIEAN